MGNPARQIAIALAGLLISAPLVAVEFEGNKITLDNEEMQACASEGGCAVVTKKFLGKVIEAAQTCRNRT